MIIARAPTRIGIMGGGTDVDPFAGEYGGKVLNMAINLRHECYVEDDLFFPASVAIQTTIHAMGEVRDISQLDDSKFSLIKKILDSYELPPEEFRFVDQFEGTQSAGLGSSASAAVSMIGCFNKWLGIKQSKREIAERAFKAEIDLGWSSGRQDQFAAAFGGMNFFEFDKDVWGERIDKNIADGFANHCLLVFTGETRHSAKIQDKLKARMKSGQATEHLKKIRTLTWEARDAMKGGRFLEVGKMMDVAWDLKKKSNPSATNERLDVVYNTAMKAGAVGGKVMGAGGQGHMVFVVEPGKRKKVLKAIQMKEIDFSVDHNGLEVREV